MVQLTSVPLTSPKSSVTLSPVAVVSLLLVKVTVNPICEPAVTMLLSTVLVILTSGGTVAVGVGVNVAEGVGVGVKVAVAVGVNVAVAVAVGVNVAVAVGVNVAVAVAVAVGVGVNVAVGVGEAQPPVEVKLSCKPLHHQPACVALELGEVGAAGILLHAYRGAGAVIHRRAVNDVEFRLPFVEANFKVIDWRAAVTTVLGAPFNIEDPIGCRAAD